MGFSICSIDIKCSIYFNIHLDKNLINVIILLDIKFTGEFMNKLNIQLTPEEKALLQEINDSAKKLNKILKQSQQFASAKSQCSRLSADLETENRKLSEIRSQIRMLRYMIYCNQNVYNSYTFPHPIKKVKLKLSNRSMDSEINRLASQLPELEEKLQMLEASLKVYDEEVSKSTNETSINKLQATYEAEADRHNALVQKFNSRVGTSLPFAIKFIDLSKEMQQIEVEETENCEM